MKKIILLALGLAFAATSCQAAPARIASQSDAGGPIPIPPTATVTNTPGPTGTPTLTAQEQATKTASAEFWEMIYARATREAARPTQTPLPPGVTFIFDSGVSDSDRLFIQEGVRMAEREFGYPGHVTVFASPDGTFLCNEKSKYYGSNCFSWNPGTGYGDFGAVFLQTQGVPKSINTYLFVIHEFYHNVQSYSIQKTISGEPPVWLKEGSADYMARRVVAKNGWISYSTYHDNYASRYQDSTISLSTCESFGGMAPAYAYDLGFLASELLARDHGDDSLLQYWRVKKTQADWRIAFKTAFGESVDDFYQKFDAWRKNGFR